MFLVFYQSSYGQQAFCLSSDSLEIPGFKPREVTIRVPLLAIDCYPYYEYYPIDIDGNIEILWDYYVDSFHLQPANLYPLDDNNENGCIYTKLAYDHDSLYILLVIEDDSLTSGDRVQFMYQKIYGGNDTGTIAGHNGDSSWQYWYWKKDGDVVWEMPPFLDEINFPDSCKGYWYDQETMTNHVFVLDSQEVINSSMEMEVNIKEGPNALKTIVCEFAFSWENWLNTNKSFSSDDIIGFDIALTDVDQIDKKVKGYYTLSSPDTNGFCCASHIAKAIIYPWTDIGKNKSLNNIKISPNPAKDVLLIENTEHVKRIEIIDLTGRILFARNNNYKNVFQVDLDFLNKGFYVLKLVYPGTVHSQVLIKQ